MLVTYFKKVKISNILAMIFLFINSFLNISCNDNIDYFINKRIDREDVFLKAKNLTSDSDFVLVSKLVKEIFYKDHCYYEIECYVKVTNEQDLETFDLKFDDLLEEDVHIDIAEVLKRMELL